MNKNSTEIMNMYYGIGLLNVESYSRQKTKDSLWKVCFLIFFSFLFVTTWRLTLQNTNLLYGPKCYLHISWLYDGLWWPLCQWMFFCKTKQTNYFVLFSDFFLCLKIPQYISTDSKRRLCTEVSVPRVQHAKMLLNSISEANIQRNNTSCQFLT